MKIIGITGGIGSGKSVVSRLLRLRGHSVYDCDFEAKRIMARDAGIKRQICTLADCNVVGADGTIDGALLGPILFSSPEVRSGVNALVHAAVRRDILQFISSQQKKSTACGEQTVWVESAILASSGLAAMCDEIWLVTAPLEVRIDRVMSRNGLSRLQVEERIASQSEEEMMIASLAAAGTPPVIEIDNSGATPILAQLPLWE